MKNISLKSKFLIAIIAGVISLLIVMFGVRLMGKVTDFAYLERQHIIAVSSMDYELARPISRRSLLLENAIKAHAQPSKLDGEIFDIEKLLFRLLGQGYLLDIAAKDILDLNNVISYLKTSSSANLTAQEVKHMDKLMHEPRTNTEKFGAGLRSAAGFVKMVVNLLVLLSIGGLVGLIVNMLRTTLPPLEQTVSVMARVAKGDLTARVENISSGEIGQMQLSTIEMIKGLRTMIEGIIQVEDLSLIHI